MYPGAEDGPHIKGQEAEAGEGGQEGGKLWRNQGKRGGGGAPFMLWNASCKNETSPTLLGNEAAAGQAAGLVHMDSEVAQGQQEERAVLPAGQGGYEWGSGQESVQSIHGVRWHEPHSTFRGDGRAARTGRLHCLGYSHTVSCPFQRQSSSGSSERM